MPSKQPTKQKRTAKPKKGLPRPIANALADFDDIARKRFEADFYSVAMDSDRNRAARRMRVLVGVIMKKEYSNEERIVSRTGELVDFKWKIDPDKLAALPADAWQFQVLRMDPDRGSRETGKDVAARLKRETLLYRCYQTVVHPYLCQSPALRAEITKILKEVGLGEFAPLSSPKVLLGVGAVKINAVLAATLIGTLPAAAITVTAFALCVIGLKRICGSEKKKKSRAGTKRNT